MLRHQATVVGAFKAMDRFIVNEAVLSATDAIVLLHKWSLIEGDAGLQEDLRVAIEQCQVRELASECSHCSL